MPLDNKYLIKPFKFIFCERLLIFHLFIKDIVWITIEIQGGKNNDIVGADQIYLYQLYQYNKGNDCVSRSVCSYQKCILSMSVFIYL